MTDDKLRRQGGGAERPSIFADINYLSEGAVRPQVWNGDFSRNIVPLTKTTVRIENGQFPAHRPSLDVEGFVLVPHKASIEAMRPDERTDAYRVELRALLLTLTGADHVDMAGGLVIRSDEEQGAGPARSQPVPFAHCDTSAAGVPHMVSWAYPAPPAEHIRRKALFNFWRLLSPGPTDLPLAVCDAHSVSADDIVPGDTYFLKTGAWAEGGFVRASKAHRWRYFPRMTVEDVLIFKQYDSDPAQPSQVPHTAFRDHTLAGRAAPRVSAETRAVAYWYRD
jgi:hypothetical protein